MGADGAVVGDQVAAGFEDEVQCAAVEPAELVDALADGVEDLVEGRVEGGAVAVEVAERGEAAAEVEVVEFDAVAPEVEQDLAEQVEGRAPGLGRQLLGADVHGEAGRGQAGVAGGGQDADGVGRGAAELAAEAPEGALAVGGEAAEHP